MGIAEQRITDLEGMRREITLLVPEAKRVLREVDGLLRDEQERRRKVAGLKDEKQLPRVQQKVAAIAAKQQKRTAAAGAEISRMTAEIQRLRSCFQDFVNNLR